jgi:uncharacterized membrane protein YfcA
VADALPVLVLGLGAFLGAIVQGLAGFAFSAVAGAILLHVMPPTDAVPLMMACSIAVQLATLVALRRTMRWRGSAVLIAGGAAGVLPALYLLHRVDTWSFRVGFGLFVASYAAYMFLRSCVSRASVFAAVRALVPSKAVHALASPVSPASRPRLFSWRPWESEPPRQWSAAVLGFASGFVGGLTAMPGALPAIWCDLTGMSKDQQRGLVQPFIVTMQLIALLALLSRRDIPLHLMTEMLVTLPALALGSALGIFLFARVDDVAFKRVVLVTLFIAGLGLVI